MAASWRQVTLLRAEIYRFLGHCMLEPFQADRPSLLRPDFWRDFPLGPANGIMRAALDKLVAITAGLATLPRDAALQKVQLEYAALFLGFGEPQAPPWESMYRTTERFMFGSPAYRVRTAMLQFGVEVAANYRQPEDHPGVRTYATGGSQRCRRRRRGPRMAGVGPAAGGVHCYPSAGLDRRFGAGCLGLWIGWLLCRPHRLDTGRAAVGCQAAWRICRFRELVGVLAGPGDAPPGIEKEPCTDAGLNAGETWPGAGD